MSPRDKARAAGFVWCSSCWIYEPIGEAKNPWKDRPAIARVLGAARDKIDKALDILERRKRESEERRLGWRDG